MTRYDPINLRSVPEVRYQHDTAFKNLVDVLHHFIQKAEFTPTEIREAALLACIHYESYQVRRIYLDPDQFNMSSVNSGMGRT